MHYRNYGNGKLSRTIGAKAYLFNSKNQVCRLAPFGHVQAKTK